MARIPSFSKAAAALAVALIPAAASGAPLPDAEELLQSALSVPKIPYQGKVMVTQWYGKRKDERGVRTSAEEMHVHFSPPGFVRREFLTVDGSVSRVIISDGETEEVTRRGKVLSGDAVRSYEKVMTPEREREVLLNNYELEVSTGEKVAGRPVWHLVLKPKVAGKVWQLMALDQETRVVLRVKRYLPRRSFASQAAFTSFEPNKPQDASLFKLSGSTVTADPALAPDFMTLAQLSKETGRASQLPESLPGGFVFESADVFKVGRGNVAHARYTDGLTVLSVFETERPVRLPKSGVISTPAAFPGVLSASRSGKVLNVKSGSRHYTLMGDVSRELLADAARALKP